MQLGSGDDMTNVPVEVAMARMEGKIDRVLDAQKRQHEDIQQISKTQDEQRQEIAKLSSLNIQERLVSHSGIHDRLEGKITAIEMQLATSTGERKGVELSAKVVYAMLAAGGLGFILIVVRFLLTGDI